MNGAKDMLMGHIRTLSQDELRELGTDVTTNYNLDRCSEVVCKVQRNTCQGLQEDVCMHAHSPKRNVPEIVPEAEKDCLVQSYVKMSSA